MSANRQVIKQIPAHMMFVDTSYQRDPVNRHDKFVKRSLVFDPKRLNILVVSKRPDGRWAILDGAGRHYMVTKILNLPNFEFNCIIHENLTYQGEVKLNKELNEDRDNHKTIDMFRLEVARGEPEAVAIMDMVKAVGLEERDIPSPEVFSILYKQGILQQTLSLVKTAWYHNCKRRDLISSLYGGIGILLTDPNINIPRLLEIMKNTPPESIKVSLKAGFMGLQHPKVSSVRAAILLVKKYNNHLSMGKRIFSLEGFEDESLKKVFILLQEKRDNMEITSADIIKMSKRKN